MFGSTNTFGASTSGGFGTNTGTTFGAAKPTFGGGGFGATSSAAPSFGGAFGSTTSTAPTFGSSSFGTGTSLATSSFGGGTSSFGFGTSTNTTPSFSFGTSTSSAAPAFGSTFGATSTASAPSFGSSFGTTGGGAFGSSFGGGNAFGAANTGGSMFGGGGNTFGGGSSFLQTQQQQAQQAPPNVTEQLLNSIMRVSLFGDDRDNLLARWNLLQASWGVGKAFYAQNQAPVMLNNENPLCRFKAIGYSSIPKGSNDTELLNLIVKKKQAELEPLKQNLINDLQAALGNKPNIKVVINEIQAYGGENSQVIFHVIESSMNGQTRKINANDIYNALSQQNTWSQLQQRHSLESIAPRVAFNKDHLDEYLKNTPYGVDPRLWKQAQLDNPDTKSLVPVPLVGFKALQARIKRQEHQAKIFQGRLDEIANDIAESQKRQQDNSAKLRDAKRKQLELSHRVLNIITRQEMTRKLGFTIQLEEEKLRIQLEALQSQLSAPTQFKGRLNELLSQVRLQSQSNGLGSNEQNTLDTFAKEDIKHLLKQQHEGIQSLVATMKQDLNALELMNEKLAKGKANNNK